jgi:CheY-like chemotaxis protein
MSKTLDGVHVLLVEDNADTVEVMKLVMEYQGGLVMTAGDAKTALRILRGLRPLMSW